MKLLYPESGHVLICGHRGNSLHAPENTIAAFDATRDAGGHSVEIDTLLTADGEIVVIHDQTVDRTTDGSGLVGAMALDQIRALDAGAWFGEAFAGARIPTLREAIDWAAANGLHLEAEIKERDRVPAYLDRFAEILAETGTAHLIAIDFDHRTLVHAKARVPGLKTQGITHARHADFVAVARSAALDSLSIEAGMYHPEDAAELRNAGVAIRCHLPRPDRIAAAEALGRDPLARVREGLRLGLIDSLSGDDVSWLAGWAKAARAR